MPLFSVLIPIYNAQRWLEDCLESVASQSFGDFEAVLLDDGSTDESAALCARWLSDRRFRLIRQTNAGVTAARLRLLELARGEFIVFVDADDRLRPDALEILAGHIRETGSDMVLYQPSEQVDFSAASLQFPFTPGETMSVEHSPLLRSTFGTTFLLNNLTNKAFRRSLWNPEILPEGLADMNVAEDLVMSLALAERARRVSFCPQLLYFYRVCPGSITRSPNPRLYRCIRTAALAQHDFLARWDPQEHWLSDWERHALSLCGEVLQCIFLWPLPQKQRKAFCREVVGDPLFAALIPRCRELPWGRIRITLTLCRWGIRFPLLLYGNWKNRKNR